MGFLHKLWDDTLAGPAPESGLGKLRKYDSLSSSPRSSPDPDHDRLSQDFPISRCITIVRSNSVGAPPSNCTTPTSPFSPTSPRAGDFTLNPRNKKYRISPFQRPPDDDHNSISPTTLHDWIVINALDR